MVIKCWWEMVSSLSLCGDGTFKGTNKLRHNNFQRNSNKPTIKIPKDKCVMIRLPN